MRLTCEREGGREGGREGEEEVRHRAIAAGGVSAIIVVGPGSWPVRLTWRKGGKEGGREGGRVVSVSLTKHKSIPLPHPSPLLFEHVPSTNLEGTGSCWSSRGGRARRATVRKEGGREGGREGGKVSGIGIYTRVPKEQ